MEKNLFDAANEQLQPTPELWRAQMAVSSVVDDAFYNRVRVLLRSGPLHHTRALSTRQSWPADRRYDSLVLSLAAVDAVLLRAGVLEDIEFDELVEVIAELASLAEPTAGRAEWEQVADWVVRSLMGTGEIQGFDTIHSDYRTGFTTASLDWRLIVERSHGDKIVLQVTTEAINALRGGLDVDVEDAELARSTVLQAQLERGDLGGAEKSAQEALRLTVELSAKLRDLIEAARFNLDLVDWEQDFQGQVQRSLDHVAGRIRAEHQLLDHMGVSPELAAESSRRSMIVIRDLLELCLARHRDLHRLLQNAPRIFLDEQARQTLHGRKRARLRMSTRDDLFLPALAADPIASAEIGLTFARGALGVAIPQLLDLSAVLGRLISPPRAEPADVFDDDPLGALLVEVDDDVAEEFRDAAVAIVSTCVAMPRRLSVLLAEAESPEVAEVVRLMALLLFDPEDLDLDDLRLGELASDAIANLAATSTGEQFCVAGYQGDDLLVGSPVDLYVDALIQPEELTTHPITATGAVL